MKMNVQALLSSGAETGRTFDSDTESQADVIRRLRKFWVEAYTKKFPTLAPYRISQKEGAMLKTLYLDYGEDRIKKAIDYFLQNFEEMPYIKSFPSVFFLCYYKRQIFVEVEVGAMKKVSRAARKGKRAQFDAQKFDNDSSWGDLL